MMRWGRMVVARMKVPEWQAEMTSTVGASPHVPVTISSSSSGVRILARGSCGKRRPCVVPCEVAKKRQPSPADGRTQVGSRRSSSWVACCTVGETLARSALKVATTCTPRRSRSRARSRVALSKTGAELSPARRIAFHWISAEPAAGGTRSRSAAITSSAQPIRKVLTISSRPVHYTRPMEGFYSLDTLILLLVAVLVCTALARRILIPDPIFLVLGGLALTFVPRLPVVPLDPEIVFLIFLPPILWSAAYFTSLRDFRLNLRPITLLAVGLVVVTTAAVAVVARAVIPGMSWPVAFALGAIVSPPDAVAATSIARKLRLPYRLVTILEGESLVNDAAALILYRVAIASTVTGVFVATETVWQFVLAAAGGTIIGLGVGFLGARAARLVGESLPQIAITLLAPYVAWILAERFHTSAVLACVAGGLYVRQGFSAQVSPITRVQARAVWDLLLFILNGLIFILIGLQLGAIREAGLPGSPGTLLWQGALISAAAIGVRLVWVPLIT